MIIMNEISICKFKELGDKRGHLVVIESLENIPFEVKRLFYMYGSDADAVRGQHANRKSEFVLINIAGSSKVRTDNGKGNIEIYTLDKPNIGLYLPSMIWKDMYDFSSDSILLVLSNELYASDEYIRNYNDFINEVKRVG